MESNDPHDEFEAYVASASNNYSSISNALDFYSLMGKINSEIESYKKESRLKATDNFMRFWQEKRHLYPLLSEIVNLFISVPLTEVSVERLLSNMNFILDRLFSNMNFILDPLRAAITRAHLGNLIFVRSNFHLLEI